MGCPLPGRIIILIICVCVWWSFLLCLHLFPPAIVPAIRLLQKEIEAIITCKNGDSDLDHWCFTTLLPPSHPFTCHALHTCSRYTHTFACDLVTPLCISACTLLIKERFPVVMEWETVWLVLLHLFLSMPSIHYSLSLLYTHLNNLHATIHTSSSPYEGRKKEKIPPALPPHLFFLPPAASSLPKSVLDKTCFTQKGGYDDPK